MKAEFNISRKNKFLYSFERGSWLLYKEFMEGVFLFDYSLNSWISIKGENLGISFVHENLGLIFKGKDESYKKGNWYTHPKFGKMPGYIDLQNRDNYFPFYSQNTGDWLLVSFSEDGETHVWDGTQTFVGDLDQVWEILQLIEGDNPNDLLNAISTHPWIPSSKIKYIKGRLVFGLPVR